MGYAPCLESGGAPDRRDSTASRNHAWLIPAYQRPFAGSRGGSAERDLFFRKPERPERRRGPRSVRARTRSTHPCCRAPRRDAICMELYSTRMGSPGLSVRSHRVGRGGWRRSSIRALQLLYDIYHMQIKWKADVIRTIRDNHQYIGHFHTGGVPGRTRSMIRRELELPRRHARDRGYRIQRLRRAGVCSD